ncbi:MAG: CBS domain-containing protein [Candidatus Sericytochromatia bacterium]
MFEMSEEERNILISRGQLKDPHPSNDTKSSYGITKPEYNGEPHYAHQNLDEKLRADQIDTQTPRVSDIGAVSGTTAIGAVQASTSPVNFADALDQWRTMSERYRNRRISRDTSSMNSNFKEIYNQENNKSTDFQDTYETDNIEVNKMQSFQNPNKKADDIKLIDNLVNLVQNNKASEIEEFKVLVQPNFNEKITNDIREKILSRLSTANIEIEPEMVDEYDDLQEEQIIDTESLKISDFMTKNVISVIDSMTIEQVASIFNKKGITSVPVINYKTKQPIGIITMADIVEHVFSDGIVATIPIAGNINFQQDSLAVLEKPISEIMNYEPLIMDINSSVQDVCSNMTKHESHRALITENNRVRGIFTSFDAVRILAKHGAKKHQ